MRRILAAALLLLAWGCATTTPPQPPSQVLRGIASWYGQEFAGRTTANGEIFDPLLLTAAHRTLPFGTIVDVKNVRTGQSVRVRVNDRGPYIGNRIIDLSYAAAEQISLIEPGSGEVELVIVQAGRGDREPPAPFDVAIAGPNASDEPPKVEIPLPPAPVMSAGVETRRQVAPDGKTIESVSMSGKQAPLAVQRGSAFVVQVGAFSVEANAKLLREQLTRIGQPSYIEHDVLYRVRIGPFFAREQAVKVRQILEANGLSAIVMAN